MEDSVPSFTKTKITPPQSRLQSAWCCLQQTFVNHGNDSRSDKHKSERSGSVEFDDCSSEFISVANDTIDKNGFYAASLESFKFPKRPLFGKNKFLSKKYSYFPDMYAMSKRVGISFNHDVYSSRTFDTTTDLESDSVSENGEAHLSKLSYALDGQIRHLQTPPSNQFGDSTKQQTPPISPNCPIDLNGECDYNFLEDLKEPLPCARVDDCNITKMADIVLAQSEVLQLQDHHSEAIDILDQTLSEILDRLSKLSDNDTMHNRIDGNLSNEKQTLNKIVLRFCQRLGSIHKIKGDLQSAEKYASMALKLLLKDSTYDVDEEINRELSAFFSTLAAILEELGRFDEAIVADRKAIECLANF